MSERAAGRRMGRASLAILSLATIGFALDARVALRGDLERIGSEELEQVVAMVRTQRRPGDVLVHSPMFSMEELAAFGDLPIHPDLPGESIRRSRRVLVVDRRDVPMAGFGPATEVHSVGAHLELRVYEPEGGAQLTTFDLVDEIEQAKMWIERPAGQVSSRCDQARPEGGRSCPGEPEWLYLAPRDLRVGGENVRCVWAHPSAGAVIVIELPAQAEPPPGKRLELHVWGGLDDAAVTGTPDGAPIDDRIDQGGKQIGEIRVNNRMGWHETQVTIAPAAPIQIRVSAVRDGRRHHCLRAEVREVESP